MPLPPSVHVLVQLAEEACKVPSAVWCQVPAKCYVQQVEVCCVWGAAPDLPCVCVCVTHSL